jgi:hypothetical protein
MTIKQLLAVAAIISISLFAYLSPVLAADSATMEAIRSKQVLDDADLKAIDAFVAGAVGDMLETEDFSSISNTRAIIIANSASTVANQTQYAEQFSKSAQKYISAALQKADTLTPEDRSFRVTTNLLMLIDGLADVHLVGDALKYVDNKNEVIRYWAVHCVTNPEITEKLNNPKAIDTARQVIRRLDEVIPISSPDTLGLIATFAGSIKMPEGESLLLKVADKRIAAYADWSVRDEFIDTKILQVLGDVMVSSSAGKEVVGKRFGQLLSYVYQRYVKGGDYLADYQKEQLVSVLVDTEKNSISKIIGKPRFGIKKAIEAGDNNALRQEINNLLGDETKAGEFGINYGKDAGGNVITHPLVLGPPPAQ